jgi:hypothetical protein
MGAQIKLTHHRRQRHNGAPMMRRALGFVAAGLLAASVRAQDAADVQRLFESGRDQQVVDGVRTGSEPAVVYLAAQSYERLGNPARALELYQTLSRRSAKDAWRWRPNAPMCNGSSICSIDLVKLPPQVHDF